LFVWLFHCPDTLPIELFLSCWVVPEFILSCSWVVLSCSVVLVLIVLCSCCCWASLWAVLRVFRSL
jgi:hypothetical protein